MQRIASIAAGVFAHAFFGVTVVRLVLFLHDTHYQAAAGSMAVNWLLALQFVMPHSVLLYPSVRKRLTAIISGYLYGCFFTVVTCASLWLTFCLWRASPIEVWRLTGWAGTLMNLCFVGAWVTLFYSLSLTGLGWQTGWTPWYHWLRGREQPKRSFEPRSLYKLVRHPVYASFMGLLWLTPLMTLDRAILTGVWTVYIFLGGYLKDERLAYFMGETYRHYQTQVVGFPGMFIGPLGRRRAPVEQTSQSRAA